MLHPAIIISKRFIVVRDLLPSYAAASSLQKTLAVDSCSSAAGGPLDSC